MSLAIPHQFRKKESPISSTKVNENNAVIVSYINDLNASITDGSAITDGTITTSKIADNAITNAKMADNAIDTIEIVDDAVTTEKILDGAITVAKLANSAIATFMPFGDGYDGALHITSGTITANGIKRYTDVTIDAGCTLTHDTNRALTMYVQGTLTLNGSINVDGKSTFTKGGYCGAGGGGGGGGSSTEYEGDGETGSAGYSGLYSTGGNGGIGGSSSNGSNGSNGQLGNYLDDLNMSLFDSGTKGGNGGKGNTNDGVYAVGGVGGNGGGCVSVYAKNIVFGGSSVISAKGSNGSAGQGGFDPSGAPGRCAGGGGGGGGSGGAIIVLYQNAISSPTYYISGGSGGSGGTGGGTQSGGNGGNGSDGIRKTFQLFQD